MYAVTFELGISLGEISKVEFSTGEVPPLDDAFTWFVRAAEDGVVTIHARYDNKVREIARARWSYGRLVERSAIRPGFPSDQQWKLVTTALGRVMRRAVEGAPLWRRVLATIDPTSRPILLGAIIMGLAMIGVVVMIFVVRTKEPVATSTAPTPTPAPAPPPAPAVAPPPNTLAKLAASVAKSSSFSDVLDIARPLLGDGLDNQGAWLVAHYTKLVWSDVANRDDTSVPLVLKDSERERGKRLCVTGKLSEIERADVEGHPVHVGALRTTDGDDVRFIALGSTGMLVKRSDGQLCGVATGKHDEAAVIVGLFDLPENRTPSVER